jgi:hypothetical protein
MFNSCQQQPQSRSLFGSGGMLSQQKKEDNSAVSIVPRVWGNFSFDFNLNTKGDSLYQTGILHAEAETSGMPLAVACKWYRIKNN